MISFLKLWANSGLGKSGDLHLIISNVNANKNLLPIIAAYIKHKSGNIICLYVNSVGVCFKEISGFYLKYMKGWRQPKDVSRVLCVIEENVKNVGFPAGKTITSLIGCPVVLCLAFSVFKSKGKFNLGRRYFCLSVSKVTCFILFFFFFYAVNLLKFELYPCLPL